MTSTTQEEGRAIVKLLVDRFASNRNHYRESSFTETATRNQFIDPLLSALGWDVADQAGMGARRDVLVESQQRAEAEPAGAEEWDDDLTEAEVAERSGTTTFPDYILRTDGTNRIVVEAKKPSVNLRFKAPSFQAKSYAWSMKLPIAVLTDFEELRVFDARFRPEYERPDAGAVPGLDLKYTEYTENWDRIWALLSREAVLGGSLDQRSADRPVRGATPVDKAFLAELASWRVKLATELKDRNPDLDRYEVAEATQRILDRLVFVRTMEDRGILDSEVLRRFARRADSYRHIIPEFRRLDAVYNGQIFAEHFSERLDLPDGLFQRMIESLYYPFSPYRFDAVPTDLLGSIYERFLGQEIVIEYGGVVVQDKPEVRHAGGVYYTPRWIVDRIVAETVGPLVKGKTPRAVANLCIVDCACGSGAFLLGAFDFLVRWHQDYYEANPRENANGHFVTASGERRLTSDTKSEILSKNLYGVDIDPQAVEVTQMSLYLAMLSQEDSSSLRVQQRLFESAFLPRLDKNIRCGNSLLSTKDVPSPLFNDEQILRRINPFDWHDDWLGFGEVFKRRGGFDAVIMNPPYVRTQDLRKYRNEEVTLYQQSFRTAAEGSFDLASLFVERVLELLRPDGRMGFITSRQFMETASGRPVREILSAGRHVREIVDFVDGLVFEGASAYTALLFASKKATAKYKLTRVPPPPTAESLRAAKRAGSRLSASLPASSLGASEWDLLLPREASLLERLSEQNRTLSDVCGDVIFQGVITGADYIYRLADAGPDPSRPGKRRVSRRDTGVEGSIESDLLRPVLGGKADISRFTHRKASEVLLLPYRRRSTGDRFRLMKYDELTDDYPGAHAWLHLHESELRARKGGWTDSDWWGYSRRQNLELFDEPKILIPYMLDDLCALADTGSHYFVNVSTGGYGIPSARLEDADFTVALLHSDLLSWVLRRYSRAFRGGWFAARKASLGRIPIAGAHSGARAEVIADYAACERSLAQVGRARSDSDQRLARQVHARAMDAFNYSVEALYGITDLERSAYRPVIGNH